MNLFGQLVGLLGRGDQPDARPLYTLQHKKKKKRAHVSMPQAGFEPANPVFEQPKTVDALDSAGIGTGMIYQ
jgi:hypothetical protein